MINLNVLRPNGTAGQSADRAIYGLGWILPSASQICRSQLSVKRLGQTMGTIAGIVLYAGTGLIAPSSAAVLDAAAKPLIENQSARDRESPDTQLAQRLAQILSVRLDARSGQLQIQTDRPVAYTSRWNGSEYQLLLSPAQISPNLQGPQLEAAGPLARVRLRQTSAQTVLLLIQPAARFQIGSATAPRSNLIVIPIRSVQVAQPPLTQPPPQTPLPMPNPTPTDVPQLPQRQGRFLVVIDPGHGGPDPGAVGIGGLQEKDVVLPIALQVAQFLQQQGVQVVLTRSDDRDLGLEPRVKLARDLNATLFVSIHANAISMSRPEVNGVETYYYRTGLDLANTIHQQILQRIRMNDRGVRQARFYVLRRTPMPAVLVEVGFVTGVRDAPQLRDPQFQQQMAIAIASGILLYLQQQN